MKALYRRRRIPICTLQDTVQWEIYNFTVALTTLTATRVANRLNRQPTG